MDKSSLIHLTVHHQCYIRFHHVLYTSYMMIIPDMPHVTVAMSHLITDTVYSHLGPKSFSTNDRSSLLRHSCRMQFRANRRLGSCWEMAEHDIEMNEAEGQRRTDTEMVMMK